MNPTLTLNDSRKMPILGLGGYGIHEEDGAVSTIKTAIDYGYRHIDTAKFYKNEAAVGEAVRNSGVKRKDIWVTTKIWPTDYFNPRKAIESSLAKLDIEYIDLYLLHWPTPVEIPGFDNKLWKEMEKFREEGLCRSIGLSNFREKRLLKILSSANQPPAVNQIECSAFVFPTNLVKVCNDNNIAVVGYRPINNGKDLNNPNLVKVANKYKKTPAQILIRWLIQQDISAIPKSSNLSRIKENMDVFDFELDSEDMKNIKNF